MVKDIVTDNGDGTYTHRIDFFPPESINLTINFPDTEDDDLLVELSRYLAWRDSFKPKFYGLHRL